MIARVMVVALAVTAPASWGSECSWLDVTRVDRVSFASQTDKGLRVAIFDSGVQLEDPGIAPALFRNGDDPPGPAVNRRSAADGCPGACGTDDDGDGAADRADPDVVALVARFERACAESDTPLPAACERRSDGSNPWLDRLIDLDDDENGLPDDYHGYDFYAESRCLLDTARETEPCRPQGPPRAHGTWVAQAFHELGLADRVELIIVRITQGSHGVIPETDGAWQRAFASAVDKGARLIVLAGGALNHALCPRLKPLFEAADPPLLVTAAGNLTGKLDDLDARFRHWPGQCGYPATLLVGAAYWSGQGGTPCSARHYPGTMSGRSLDLIAPGSLDDGNFQQTSAAASYAAAAAARLWLSEGFADCGALGIRRALREGSREIGEIRRGTEFADGRFLDLAGARAFGCRPSG